MGALDGSGHAPAFEEKDEIARAVELASKLCLVEDPPSEPFRSKYKAREALRIARQRLLENGEITASSTSVALIDYHLGVIALAVEENSSAQEALDKAADAFFRGVVGKVVEAAGSKEEDGSDEQGEGADARVAAKEELPVPTEAPPGMASPSPLAWHHRAEAADSLMQLGLLWAARGYPRRSLLYLLASVSFLREASTVSSNLATDMTAKNVNIGNNPASDDGETEGRRGGEEDTSDRDGEEKDSLKGQERKTKLESLLTHAFYYLAQAYGTQDAEQSAKYCVLTLQRQLAAHEGGHGADVSFDPGEWSRNACFLADYYASLDQFPAAGRCLLAARAVLSGHIGGRNRISSEKNSDTCSTKDVPVISAIEPTPAITTTGTTSEALVGPSESGTDPNQGVQATNENGKGARHDTGGTAIADGAVGQEERVAEAVAAGNTAAEATFADESAPSETELRAAGNAPPPPPSKAQPGLAAPLAGGGDDDGGCAFDPGDKEIERKERGDADDPRREVTEEREELRADVERHMAKLYITVLQTKHQERGLVEAGIDPDEAADLFPTRRKPQGRGEKGEAIDVGVEGGLGFGSLGLGELPVCDPTSVRGDFESVREVFKRAKSHTERALQHYVLDGFVTAHVVLQQGLSRAYLYLGTFETDTKRKWAMCNRRAQALKPLLEALGRKAYARLHKELSFELGEIHQDLADIKASRLEEKMVPGARGITAADVRAINKLLQGAIGFFSHFVAMYHDGDPEGGAADSPAQPAEGMDAAEAAGYLQARFMRARLYGKLQFSDSEQKMHVLRSSCAEFTWLVENARGHLSGPREKDPGIFEQELELAEEMAQLQRRNIANLQQELKKQQPVTAAAVPERR